MKIWLDDERPAPDGWTWCKDPKEALVYLLSEDVEEMSFDHDLGWFVDGKEITGYDLLCAMEKGLVRGLFIPEEIPKLYIHSANAGARKKMMQSIESIEQMVVDRLEDA